MSRFFLALLIVAFAFCQPAKSDVLNGSFEIGGLTNWANSGNLSTSGSQGQTDGTVAVAFNFGNTFPNGVLSQTLVTVNGQTYNFRFDFGEYAVLTAVNTGVSVSLDVDVFDGTGFAGTQLLDQTLVDNTAVQANDSSVFDSYQFQFTASSSSTTIRFTDTTSTVFPGTTNTFGYDAMLDNVSVTAVPEPSGLLVCLGGLFAIGTRRRRRS